jgi:hypothetical protein
MIVPFCAGFEPGSTTIAAKTASAWMDLTGGTVERWSGGAVER